MPLQRIDHRLDGLLLALVGEHDARNIAPHRRRQPGLAFFPFGNLHARQPGRPPLPFSGGNINAVPAADEPAQRLQHLRALAALRGAAEDFRELLLIASVRAAFQQSLQQLLFQRLRHLALQQLEASAGHTQLVLETPHHLREKGIHRPQGQPRQFPRHLLQQLREIHF